MKYMNKFSIAVVMTLIAGTTSAAQFTATGKIVMMRTHGSFWGSHSWIQIQGAANIASCTQNDEGVGMLTNVVIPASENNIYSYALAAHLADKPVKIRFTNDTLIYGFCTIQYISM